MIDLHFHLLPGIDDGAADLRESLALARVAADDGCTAIVATPHLRHERWWNRDRERLAALCAELREALPEAGLGGVEVHLGGEVAVHSESFEELLQLPGGDLLTLAGSRYVLLELPWRPLGPDPGEVVHELVVHGLVPVIAHPERVSWLMDDLPFLARLRRRGALLQLTAASVIGELGPRPERSAERMLEAALVDFVASDAHGLDTRPPGLAAARRHLALRHGEDLARRLTVDNPRAVVEDRPLPA